MTSNIGSHYSQSNFEKLTDENRDQVIEQTKNQVFEILKKIIRPEFLNRIDDTIMSTPLTKDEIKDIIKLQFKELNKLLLKRQYNG